MLDAMGAVQDAAEQTRALVDAPKGHLRVTGPADIGLMDFAGLVAEFLRTYPDITVEMLLTQRTVDLVAEGYDVALRAGPLADSSLMARRIEAGRARLFAAPSYVERRGLPANLDDLTEHDCILFKTMAPRARWPLWRGAEALEVEVQGRLTANDYSFLRDATLAGVGISLLPDAISRTLREDQRLVPILPDLVGHPTEFAIVYSGGRLLSAKVRVFRDFAVQWLAGLNAPEAGPRD